MIDIAIEYPFLFLKRKATGLIPTTWAELSIRQFLAISRTINGAAPDFRFLSVLTGIRKSLLKKLSPFNLFKISGGIDFISKPGNFYHSFIIRDIQGTDFVSPKPKLESLTFGQFIFVDSYFNDWIATKDETALNNFIASLYLLPGEKFDNKIIPERSRIILNADIDIRKAVAFNYSLVIAWLQKAYPLIFREPIEQEPPTGDKPTAGAKQSPWIKLFESLVGDDLINRDKYAELPVHTVFRHLTKKYKENARK